MLTSFREQRQNLQGRALLASETGAQEVMTELKAALVEAISGCRPLDFDELDSVLEKAITSLSKLQQRGIIKEEEVASLMMMMAEALISARALRLFRRHPLHTSWKGSVALGSLCLRRGYSGR